MKFTKFSFSCALVLLLLFNITIGQDEDDEDEPEEPEPMKLVAKASMKFSRNLYNMLKTSSNADNLVFSPSSMNILLAMLRKGARGIAGNELRTTLELTGIPDSTINEGYSEYLQSFPEQDDIEFESIQRVYVPFSHRIRPEYGDLLLEGFKTSSGVKAIDFTESAPAVEKINSWVKRSSTDKIENIVSADLLSPDSKLVLVSGVYFKGEWDKSFTTSNRETDVFYSNDTYSTYVTMMNQNGRFKYADLQVMNAEAIAVPFANERLEFIILLPRDRNGLEWPLEAKLKDASLASILARMKKRNVNVFIPKFEMESYLAFTNGGLMLQKMGLLSSLARGTAHFSGISAVPGLYVDKLIQKTIFQMTESGLQAPSEPPAKYKPGREPIVFRANRPFIAHVYDTETKSVLLTIKKVK